MEFVYRRSYRGPVKLVVLDWAGTTMDHGCYAPAVVFIEVYRRRGVEITMEQARRPMGLHKRDHIKAIGQFEDVATVWQQVHGRPMTEQDVDGMFADFQPLQLQCLADYADLSVCWVRVTAVIALMLTGFWPMVLVYIVAAIFLKPAPVVEFTDEEDWNFYQAYVSDRKLALSRLKRRCEALDRRTRRMENVVTKREYDWDRRFQSET